MIDFQENAVWSTKFVDMNLHLQKLEMQTELNGYSCIPVENRAENIILTNGIPYQTHLIPCNDLL